MFATSERAFVARLPGRPRARRELPQQPPKPPVALAAGRRDAESLVGEFDAARLVLGTGDVVVRREGGRYVLLTRAGGRDCPVPTRRRRWFRVPCVLTTRGGATHHTAVRKTGSPHGEALDLDERHGAADGDLAGRAVLSFGANNHFGHPEPCSVALHENWAAKLLSTADRGPSGDPAHVGLHWTAPASPTPPCCVESALPLLQR